MAQNDNDPLLLPEDVAKRLGVPVSRLASWRLLEKGPAFVRLGYRTVRYRQSAVEAFITARERDERDEREDG